MTNKIVNNDIDYSKWNVEKPLKDVVWVLMVDEPDSDIVELQSGIVVSTVAKTKGRFRIGQVLKCGDKCEYVKEKDFVLIPPSVGIYGLKSIDGYKTQFVKEDVIMAVISFEGSKDDFIRHAKEQLQAGI